MILDSKNILLLRNVNKLCIEYQSYSKPTKIEAFKTKNMHMSYPYHSFHNLP